MTVSNSRRQLLRLLTLGSGCALLAACAPAAPPAPKEQPKAAEPTAAAADSSQAQKAETKPAEGKPAPAVTGGRTKINFAWPFAATTQAFQEELAKRFMEQNKSIEVEVEIIPQAQVLPKLTTAFSAGAGPDAVAIATGWTAQFASAGWLENLEERLKSSGLDNDLLPTSMVQARVYKNTAYSAGFLLDAYALYYNKQLFADAGLAEAPKTLDEFSQHAKKVTDPAKNRFGYYLLGGSGWAFAQWSTWMLASGGVGANNTLFDAGGKCVLNEPRRVAGLERWLAMYKEDKVSPSASATATFNDASNAFNAGQVGMVMGWMGYIANFSGGLGGDKFGVALPPAGPAGQFFYYGGNGYALNAQSKNKEAAWEYVKFLLTPEVNALVNQTWGAIPANSKALNQDWLKGPHFQAPLAIAQKLEAHVHTPLHFPEWGQFQITYSPEQVQKALLGQQTAQQHAENVAKFLDDARVKAAG